MSRLDGPSDATIAWVLERCLPRSLYSSYESYAVAKNSRSMFGRMLHDFEDMREDEQLFSVAKYFAHALDYLREKFICSECIFLVFQEGDEHGMRVSKIGEIYTISVKIGYIKYILSEAAMYCTCDNLGNLFRLPGDISTNRYEDVQLDANKTVDVSAKCIVVAMPLGMDILLVMMFHEFAHYLNGHVAYIVKISSDDPHRLVKYRTLEWDADQFAASYILAWKIEAGPQVSKSVFGFKNIDVLRYIIMAVYLSFRLIDDGDYPAEVWVHSGSKHPPPRLRIKWAVGAVEPIVKHFMAGEVLRDAVRRVEYEVELASWILGRQSRDWAPILPIFSNFRDVVSRMVAFDGAQNRLAALVQYRSRLDTCWKRIRPELNLLKHGARNTLAL